jgi:hypothetical protein
MVGGGTTEQEDVRIKCHVISDAILLQDLKMAEHCILIRN